MPRHDRAWFERTVRALGETVRVTPRPRQRALFDALKADDESGARALFDALDLDADDDPGARARPERSQPSPRDAHDVNPRAAGPHTDGHDDDPSDGGDGAR